MNALVLLILFVVAVMFFFLAALAWRSRSAIVRFLGVILAGLLGLAALAVVAVALLGFYRLNNTAYTYTDRNIPVTGSPEALARGERLANICTGCHSTRGELPLDGSGEDFLAGPGAPPIGTLWATDLTPSGPLKDWSDAEVARAIREGVDNQGRPLIIMPSQAFHAMSDEDVMALVAYLRSQPPSGRSLPDRNLNALAALFVGAGMFPTAAQEPITEPVTAPPAGTPEYGGYLSQIGACRDCHGATLSGEPGFDGSSAPNLRVRTKDYTPEQFLTFFTTGENPEGRVVAPEAMPWLEYRRAFTDEELVDLYNYLAGLPVAGDGQ